MCAGVVVNITHIILLKPSPLQIAHEQKESSSGELRPFALRGGSRGKEIKPFLALVPLKPPADSRQRLALALLNDSMSSGGLILSLFFFGLSPAWRWGPSTVLPW